MLTACASTNLAPIRDASFVPAKDESDLWEDAERIDRKLVESEFLVEDDELQAYLRDVAARIAPHLGLAGAEFRLHVVEAPTLNAFALPNGSVYLHSGILTAIEDEAQLATILGHELAHFVLRHAIRQRRSERNRRTVARVFVGMLALAVAAGGDANLVMQTLQLGDEAAREIIAHQILGYKRELEREADHLALEAMAAAGYEPAAAAGVFEALLADSGSEAFDEPYFFGSHPSLRERVENSREFAARMAEPQRGERGAARYEQRVATLLLRNAELDLDVGRPQRARKAMDRHLRIAGGSARAHLLEGRVYRRLGDRPENLQAAAGAFNAALQYEPDDPQAHRELGLVLRLLGDHTDARQLLRRFLELEPEAVDRPILEAYLKQEETE